MNEKEKRAIEILKEIKDVRGIRQDVEGENEDLCALDIVYNLVDKQQKEIEEKTTILLAGAEKVKQLEKEIKKYKKFIEDKTKIGKYIQTFINKGYVEQEYISKDKIRDFYKKYCKEAMNEFSPYIKDNATPEKERKSGQIKILEKIRKELLGE